LIFLVAQASASLRIAVKAEDGASRRSRPASRAGRTTSHTRDVVGSIHAPTPPTGVHSA
jgi:hypothetical protein